jgi:predicted GNAT family acetyltransferase
MKVRTYTNPKLFLDDTQAELESNEVANSLMLGICGQLIQHPEWFITDPCLKMAEDETGLILAAAMTPPHKLVISPPRRNLGGVSRVLVNNLFKEGWRLAGVMGPSEAAQAVAVHWAEVTGNGFELERRQSVYELREAPSPAPERGKLRLATQQDAELVEEWRYSFHSEIFGQAEREYSRRVAKDRIGHGDIYLFEMQRPVSIAMTTRPTRHGISIGLVYTPP